MTELNTDALRRLNSEYALRAGLDFETFATVDLPKKGAANYFADPDFEPLIAAMEVEDFAGRITAFMFDFVLYPDEDVKYFKNSVNAIKDRRVFAAHNASFEYNVMQRMNLDVELNHFLDTAVVASYYGAGRSLAKAAPQLLGVDKMAEGRELIMLFSVPNKRFNYQRVTREHLLEDPELMKKWDTFKVYCALDAHLSLMLSRKLVPNKEFDFWDLTTQMNLNGWTVDQKLLSRFEELYDLNKQVAIEEFLDAVEGAEELNLNSPIQLKEWCRERGVNSASFDEKTVDRLLTAVLRRLDKIPQTDKRRQGYEDVKHLLQTKQILGGSALKKLKVIRSQLTSDGKLKDQYLHLGASQTFRTTGRGVQMQNLKRLPPHPIDPQDVYDYPISNTTLAANMRQLFTASNPDVKKGALIVGDFSSVESRALGWLAKEEWKLDYYEEGKDIYKATAATQYGISYEDVTKEQRKFGKLAELSCGYGAGPTAVCSFAEGMGIHLETSEALEIVRSWRIRNEQIVKFWDKLQYGLGSIVKTALKWWTFDCGYNAQIHFAKADTPESLLELHPGAQTIEVQLKVNNHPVFTRTFHGCYMRGKDICYFKPSERKEGPLWVDQYTNIKTKQKEFYKIYGGKLAGIITQSFCREIFFAVLQNAVNAFYYDPGVKVIGQFHDEIVVDFDHDKSLRNLIQTVGTLERVMSDAVVISNKTGQSTNLVNFPLAAEVNFDWRYIK
nr:MAG TPA_asm: DNA polymerase I [Caudoviricetes sp.]